MALYPRGSSDYPGPVVLMFCYYGYTECVPPKSVLLVGF